MNKLTELTKQKKRIINLVVSFILIFSSVSMVGCSEDSKVSAEKKIQTTQAAQKNDSDKQKQNSNYEKVKVTRHIDGDTLEIKHDNGKVDKLRFIGINTPESTKEHEQYGQEASNYTKDKLLNKTVYIEKDTADTDKYGRLLRYVWLDVPKEVNEQEIKTKMFNYILAAEGYAQQMTIQPNVKYGNYFKTAVQEARTGNKGLWAINPNGTTKGDKVVPITTKKNTSNKKTSNLNNNTNRSSNNNNKQKITKNTHPKGNTSQNNEAVVYSTRTGKCYHNAGCSCLRKSKIKTTVKNAKAAGLRPCKRCNPPQ